MNLSKNYSCKVLTSITSLCLIGCLISGSAPAFAQDNLPKNPPLVMSAEEDMNATVDVYVFPEDIQPLSSDRNLFMATFNNLTGMRTTKGQYSFQYSDLTQGYLRIFGTLNTTAIPGSYVRVGACRYDPHQGVFVPDMVENQFYCGSSQSVTFDRDYLEPGIEYYGFLNNTIGIASVSGNLIYSNHSPY